LIKGGGKKKKKRKGKGKECPVFKSTFEKHRQTISDT